MKAGAVVTRIQQPRKPWMATWELTPPHLQPPFDGSSLADMASGTAPLISRLADVGIGSTNRGASMILTGQAQAEEGRIGSSRDQSGGVSRPGPAPFPPSESHRFSRLGGGSGQNQ